MAEVDNTSYYTALGVEKTATPGEIKRAYLLRARQYHPDKNPDDPTAEAKFQELSEAYQTLSDPEKRELYNKYGKEGLSSPGDIDPRLLFQMLFGGPLFEDMVGEMNTGLVMKLMSEEKPADRTDEEHQAKIEEAVAEANRERIEMLAYKLLIRIEPAVTGVDKERVKQMVEDDVAQRVEAPGGGAILCAVGYAYQSEGSKKLKSFLGLGGFAASVREKGHKLSQGWKLAKSLVALNSAAQKLEEPKENESEDDVQRRADLEEKAMRHGVAVLWKLGLFEIEEVTRAACQKILQDYSKGVTHELRQQRASALTKLGGWYQKMAKQHSKDSGDVLADLSNSLDSNASKTSSSSDRSSPTPSSSTASSSTPTSSAAGAVVKISPSVQTSTAPAPTPSETSSKTESTPISLGDTSTPASEEPKTTPIILGAPEEPKTTPIILGDAPAPSPIILGDAPAPASTESKPIILGDAPAHAEN